MVTSHLADIKSTADIVSMRLKGLREKRKGKTKYIQAYSASGFHVQDC